MAGERDFRELTDPQRQRQLCVGLDTDTELLLPRLPELGLNLPAGASDAEAVVAFNQRVIEVTADIAGCYKPNAAFYEQLGYEGYWALDKTVQAMDNEAKDVPRILDAKRGDIGSTNMGYVRSIFDRLGFDAVTVSPYLSGEALQPFLKRTEKGIIVLGRTSNPGADEFQAGRRLLNVMEKNEMLNGPARELGGQLKPEFALQAHLDFPQEWTIEEHFYVAHRVANHWNVGKNCGLVAGAPYPEEAKVIRGIVGPDMFLLIPGVGAQGQTMENIVPAALKAGQRGVVNVSRGISFIKPNEGERYFDAVRRVTLEYHNQLLAAQEAA